MPSNGRNLHENPQMRFHTLVTIAELHPAAGGSRDS